VDQIKSLLCKTEFVVKNILVISLISLFSFQAISADKLVYTFKKLLVGSGELIYEIEKNEDQSESFYKLKSSTKIYVFKKLKKQLDHVSINNEDLSPIKNTYCQYPRPKNGDNSCVAMNFNADGTYFSRAYEARIPVLQDLVINAGDVSSFDMKERFSDFTAYADQTHDIASFFLYPRYFNLTEADSGKEFYVSILKLQGKIIIDVKKYKTGFLKLVFSTAPGTDAKIASYIPKNAIFDIKKKVITSLLLRSSLGDINMKLNKKKSRLNY
jgi:hypothetical protein